MKKRVVNSLFLILLMLTMCGCGPIGSKDTGIAVIYGVTAILSLILLIGYCCITRKKEVWFLLLFASVLVVNIGYFALSISRNLEEALLANRISYLGSVFLPMAMLMIILTVTGIKYRKWLSSLLLGIAIAVFLIAASPGYLDIYYKEVAFEIANGVSILHKVYGPWHCIYLFYLLGYFAVTCGVVIYVAAKRKLGSAVHGAILAAAVFVNIGVWLIEQLVQIDFEILSISYIISEIFLLALHMVMQEYTRLKALVAQQPAAEDTSIPEATPEPCNCSQETPSIDFTQFDVGLISLTKTERTIYECYLAGKTTKEIMAELNIKENTLKFHNKNLYGKLGVSSRKQLLEIARAKSAEPL